jgi:hypothetical protein
MWKGFFERLLGITITDWPEDGNGVFVYPRAPCRPTCETEADEPSGSADDMTDDQFAAVLYLAPDAPADSGLTVYRNAGWGVADTVANRYNRLVVYDPQWSHCAARPFGDDAKDGNLHMAFRFAGRQYIEDYF